MRITLLLSGSITRFAMAAFCAAIVSCSAQAQFVWSERVAANASWPEGEPNTGLAMDTNDNCYIGGFFDGTNDFGGVVLTNSSVGGPDLFLAKYNRAGALQWVQQAGGTTANYGRAVGLDAVGNIYVTGGYSGAANFAGTTLPTPQGEQFFLAKYDPNGVMQWVQTATGGYDDNYGIGLAVDSAGNSYALAVVDHSGGTMTFGSVTVTSTSGGTTLLALVKYDHTGTAQWAQLFDSTQETYGSKVAVDAQGNVYVRAMFESDMTVGTSTFSSSAPKNTFIAKFDGDGNLSWIRQPTGGSSGEGGVAVDTAGNVYISGGFLTKLDFGNRVTLTSTAKTSAPFGNAFLAKYDGSGAIKWAKAAGGANGGFYWDVALDAQTNIYVAGLLGYNAAVAKYNSAGTLQWADSATGPHANPVASAMVRCAADPLGNCYVGGFYQGTAAFGPATGTNVLQPQETWNCFLAQASPGYAMFSVSANPPGAGRVSPNYDGHALIIGKSYTMAAVPTRGCVFLGWTGGRNSTRAVLTLAMEPGLSLTANFKDVTPPVLAITYPKAKQTIYDAIPLASNAVITVTGKASDNVGVAAVYYQLNNGTWELANGTANWSAPNLQLLLGTNVFRACAADAAGNHSRTNTVIFFYALKYTGVYLGQVVDDPSSYPGGFGLFVDASQKALLIGGDPYNNEGGDPVYSSCTVVNGHGHSDIDGNSVSFTINPDGSVGLTVDADQGSANAPWHWAVTGQLVSSSLFQSVAGGYSGSASTSKGVQTIQGILSPDGWFYSGSPNHGGGGRGQFTAYGQPMTEDALGHSVSTLRLNQNATISATVTNSSVGTVNFNMRRTDALPQSPH